MSAPARFGRYRVERRLGSGAFATVWLAHDEVLDAPVAVKVLADNWAHRLDVRERFEEEARILRRADSDRVVRVHDIGELDDGRPYFVMTYADRGTLADRLDAGPLPLPVALRYAADVARGLAVLHEVGFIHRDVNPHNVLLRSGRDAAGDRVLVADLGLAKAAAHGSGFTLTVGTPGYMAPEQASGGGISRRTDVYAVGALLHHLITGVPPEPDEPPTVGPDVPPGVEAVLRQALARRPEDRFPSAGALADALDAAAVRLQIRPAPSPAAARRPAAPTSTAARRPAAEPPPAAAEDTLTLQIPPVRRRRRGLFVALLAALVVLVAGAGVALFLRQRATLDVATASGLRVTVPARWGGQQQADGWDLAPLGGRGEGTALVVASDVARWRDPASATPGVFVGVARGVTGGRLLAASAAGRCPYVQEQRELPSGLAGTVRRHECPGAPARVVDAVLTRPGADFLVFVQVKEPLADDDATRVLDSVAVGSDPLS